MNKNRQQLSKPFYNIADNEGLRRAYNQPNRIYVNGNRMYVAGTTWTDDRMNVSKPPLYTMLLRLFVGLFLSKRAQRISCGSDLLELHAIYNYIKD